MSTKRGKISLIIYLIIPLIVIIDQIFKKIVERNFSVSESIPIIKDILHITYVKNTGILWGLLRGYNVILILISILAILGIISFIIKKNYHFFYTFSLILVLSGALSNLIDRFIRGYIVDFIDIRIWPVFNLADIAITVGIIFLGIGLVRTQVK